MTTSLLNGMVALNKDLQDNWAGTTTAVGSTAKNTLVDEALLAKSSDWITDDSYEFITSGTSLYDQRKIISLSSSTLTVLAHTAAISSGVTYQIHRTFAPDEKRDALILAAKQIFPDVYAKIRDSSRTTGNWLLNGDMEQWASTANPDNWAMTAGLTPVASTTSGTYLRGSKSVKLTGTAGYIVQGWAENDDLKLLRGQTVTLRARGYSTAASTLRLAITDGASTSYSSYHPGNSAWTDWSLDWYVQHTFSDTAASIQVRIYSDVAAATSYVDDVVLTGPPYPRIYIGDLGLALDRPLTVSANLRSQYRTWDATYRDEPWQTIHNVRSENNGWINLPGLQSGLPLRIEGYGYAGFTASGVASTAWTATIDINEPQVQILSAAAAMILYRQQMQPNQMSGSPTAYAEAYAYWKNELAERSRQFRMPQIPLKMNWG